MHFEESMASDKLRMDYSAYLPEISVFGKQTLYAQGVPSNLLPRTIVGVGFTWNLFDGLERERQIAQARIAKQSVTWSRLQAESELSVLVTELYSTMQQAIEDAELLKTTIILNEEVLRMQKAAFAEGMATSADVIDAENVLADSRLARLASFYAYDVALAGLLSVCGIMEQLETYIE
jgi:outer membrane protein TolC